MNEKLVVKEAVGDTVEEGSLRWFGPVDEMKRSTIDKTQKLIG